MKIVPEPPGLHHVGAKTSTPFSGDDAQLRPTAKPTFRPSPGCGVMNAETLGKRPQIPDGPAQRAPREARGARDGVPSLATGAPSGPLSGSRSPPRPETAPPARLRLQTARAPAPGLPHGPAARPPPALHSPRRPLGSSFVPPALQVVAPSTLGHVVSPLPQPGCQGARLPAPNYTSRRSSQEPTLARWVPVQDSREAL